jgi:hypothetical protein
LSCGQTPPLQSLNEPAPAQGPPQPPECRCEWCGPPVRKCPGETRRVNFPAPCFCLRHRGCDDGCHCSVRNRLIVFQDNQLKARACVNSISDYHQISTVIPTKVQQEVTSFTKCSTPSDAVCAGLLSPRHRRRVANHMGRPLLEQDGLRVIGDDDGAQSRGRLVPSRVGRQVKRKASIVLAWKFVSILVLDLSASCSKV